MWKSINLRVPAVWGGVLAIALGTSARADDCLVAPGRVAAPGAHWFYQTDPKTNRKCWYLIEARPQVAPSPYDPPQQPTPFGSLFSWPPFGNSSQPDSTSGDARAAPGTRPDEDVRINARPRPVRRPNAEATLAPNPHRPPPAAHGDAEPRPPLTPTERDALFQEFLHWQVQQKPQ